MTGIDEIVNRLPLLADRLRGALPLPAPAAGGLRETAGFGENPGALRMWSHLPPGMKRGGALVVALHGCGQNAAGYDQGAGWSTLADRFGFALLLPEQTRANNPGGCFNWFLPGDTARGLGEVESVRQMISRLQRDHGIDPQRVFVTGLSAGGGLAAALLATYPEVFAAGAIIAGLPYGAASSVQEAFAVMQRGPVSGDAPLPDHALGERVRRAAPDRTRWPRVSIWQGLADRTVAPVNAEALARQWRDVHGIGAAEGRVEAIGPAEHRSWAGKDGAIAVSLYTLPGMGHAVPISAADPQPARRCGVAGSFFAETGLSSSYVIARSWGLVPGNAPGVCAGGAAPAAQAGVLGRLLDRLRLAGG